MPKTANDPHFSTSAEPNFGGRHGAVVTPSATNDLDNVAKQLIVNAAAVGTVTIIMADDPDYAQLVIPLPAIGLYQFAFQVRRVVAITGAGNSVIAIWG